MPNNIDVRCNNDGEYQDWMVNVAPFVQTVLDKLGLDRWELSVMFCRDDYIAELNKQYRSIEGPTDILSFEQGDEYVGDDNETWFTAGDLVISIDSLADNAKQFSVSENEELKRLLIHGILHLNGMDHTTNDTDEEMLQVQEKILAGFSGEVIIKD